LGELTWNLIATHSTRAGTGEKNMGLESLWLGECRRIPVFCDNCGQTTVLCDPDSSTRESLIKLQRILRAFEEKLSMLEEADLADESYIQERRDAIRELQRKHRNIPCSLCQNGTVVVHPNFAERLWLELPSLVVCPKCSASREVFLWDAGCETVCSNCDTPFIIELDAESTADVPDAIYEARYRNPPYGCGNFILDDNPYDPEGVLEASFTVLSGPLSGQTFQIPRGMFDGQFIFGRNHGCDLVLDSQAVSERHCVLLLDGYTLRIRDLASENGTFVNEDQIRIKERFLAHGDTVRIGELVIRVELHSSNGDR
jgi:hypothetical protein